MKKKMIYYTMKCLALCSLMVTFISVNQTCMFWIHQPQIPESAKKLKRG